MLKELLGGKVNVDLDNIQVRVEYKGGETVKRVTEETGILIQEGEKSIRILKLMEDSYVIIDTSFGRFLLEVVSAEELDYRLSDYNEDNYYMYLFNIRYNEN